MTHWKIHLDHIEAFRGLKGFVESLVCGKIRGIRRVKVCNAWDGLIQGFVCLTHFPLGLGLFWKRSSDWDIRQGLR